MNTVLLIALLSLAFVALLKIDDAFRDLTFEIRQVRAAIELQTRNREELRREWWTWAQRDSATRAEERRRRNTPTLDELMEDIG